MGANRSGVKRVARMKRAKKEMERLAKKASGQPTTAPTKKAGAKG
jgi:hypothetical protein